MFRLREAIVDGRPPYLMVTLLSIPFSAGFCILLSLFVCVTYIGKRAVERTETHWFVVQSLMCMFSCRNLYSGCGCFRSTVKLQPLVVAHSQMMLSQPLTEFEGSQEM